MKLRKEILARIKAQKEALPNSDSSYEEGWHSGEVAALRWVLEGGEER